MDYVAAYDYDPAGLAGCISLAVGEAVVVTEASREDWWVGYTQGNPSVVGHFPKTYVRQQSQPGLAEPEPEPELEPASVGRSPKKKLGLKPLTVVQALEEVRAQLLLEPGKPKELVRAAAAQLGCDLASGTALKAHVQTLCDLLDIATHWDGSLTLLTSPAAHSQQKTPRSPYGRGSLGSPSSTPRSLRSRSPVSSPRGGGGGGPGGCGGGGGGEAGAEGRRERERERNTAHRMCCAA
eukprot:COSAG05_NODE_5840_length_1076_cov_1.149437_1_plen_237_part_10